MGLGMAGKNLKSSLMKLFTACYPCLGVDWGIYQHSKWICVCGNDVETGNDKDEAGFRVPGFRVFAWERLDSLPGVYIVCFI